MPIAILAALLLASCAAVPLQETPAGAPVRHVKLGAVQLPDVLDAVAEPLSDAMAAHESEIVIDINSPGGSVTVGMALLNMMADARAGGMTITCRVGPSAMAASMAAIILEAGCTTRSMAPSAMLMFHEPSVKESGGGKEGDFRRLANQLADTNKRMAILVAPRLKHASGAAWTSAEYVAWIHDRDRWVDASEALAMGATDYVAN